MVAPMWTLAYLEQTFAKEFETWTGAEFGCCRFAAWEERHSHLVGRVDGEIVACSWDTGPSVDSNLDSGCSAVGCLDQQQSVLFVSENAQNFHLQGTNQGKGRAAQQGERQRARSCLVAKAHSCPTRDLY